MAEFNEQSVYSKHQSGCGCEDASNCGCDSNSDCGCCPPGLVAVYNEEGEHAGCLTPNDAACFKIEGEIPPEGYVKLYHPITNVFLGNVTPQEAANMLALLDPTITLPSGTDFNPTTQSSVSMAAAVEPSVSVVGIEFSIDRISCDDQITASLVGAPLGFSFVGTGTSLIIAQGASSVSDGIEITTDVAPGVYELTVQYTGCSTSKTKTITVTVS